MSPNSVNDSLDPYVTLPRISTMPMAAMPIPAYSQVILSGDFHRLNSSVTKKPARNETAAKIIWRTAFASSTRRIIVMPIISSMHMLLTSTLYPSGNRRANSTGTASSKSSWAA